MERRLIPASSRIRTKSITTSYVIVTERKRPVKRPAYSKRPKAKQVEVSHKMWTDLWITTPKAPLFCYFAHSFAQNGRSLSGSQHSGLHPFKQASFGASALWRHGGSKRDDNPKSLFHVEHCSFGTQTKHTKKNQCITNARRSTWNNSTTGDTNAGPNTRTRACVSILNVAETQ